MAWIMNQRTIQTIVALLLALAIPYSAQSKEKNLPNTLLLRGEIVGVKFEGSADHYTRYRVTLNLEFFNSGSEPVIILQPFGDYVFRLGGASLARTEAEAKAHEYFYSSAGWPSIYLFPEYRELAQRLDKPLPPSDVTRILKPKESWSWRTDKAWIALAEKPDSFSRQTLTAEEIKKMPAPIWLRAHLEMWPFNVENFKPGLGGKLRKRWSKVGVLYLEEKGYGFWFGHIASEPIPLDLSKAMKPD
jgi:hypothetical protein